MRILYHHRTRSHDGQRVHIDGLVGALRRAGHDVRVVGPRAPDGCAEGGAAGPPRASALRELAELAYNGVERARLASAARDFAPEAVYARHALFCGSAVAFAKGRGLPVIVEVNAPLALERTRHGGLALACLARRHETATLNRADRVVAVTRVLADLLAGQGVARERIDVHWNGLEPDALARAADGAPVRAKLGLDGRLVLGFVGFVRDWNRLERIFPFLARRTDATLLVVGEGPDRARLESLARARGVAARVRFLGTLPHRLLQGRRRLSGPAAVVLMTSPLLHRTVVAGLDQRVLWALVLVWLLTSAPRSDRISAPSAASRTMVP